MLEDEFGDPAMVSANPLETDWRDLARLASRAKRAKIENFGGGDKSAFSHQPSADSRKLRADSLNDPAMMVDVKIVKRELKGLFQTYLLRREKFPEAVRTFNGKKHTIKANQGRSFSISPMIKSRILFDNLQADGKYDLVVEDDKRVGLIIYFVFEGGDEVLGYVPDLTQIRDRKELAWVPSFSAQAESVDEVREKLVERLAERKMKQELSELIKMKIEKNSEYHQAISQFNLKEQVLLSNITPD